MKAMKEAKKVAVPTPHDTIMLEILYDIMTAKRPCSSKVKISDLVHFIYHEYELRRRIRSKNIKKMSKSSVEPTLVEPSQWGEYMEEPTWY